MVEQLQDLRIGLRVVNRRNRFESKRTNRVRAKPDLDELFIFNSVERHVQQKLYTYVYERVKAENATKEKEGDKKQQ